LPHTNRAAFWCVNLSIVYDKIFILNAFTANASGGNPTAVYVSRKPLEPEIMQQMAQELYVPVTAFLWATGGGYCIRYFTNQQEIAACGHATLAAAAVVADGAFGQSLCFQTVNGTSIRAEVNAGLIALTYAAQKLLPFPTSDDLLDALNVGQPAASFWCAGLQTAVIELATEADVRHLHPDFQRLRLIEAGIEEVVVTAMSDNPRYHYVLRSFCPWIGIDEDPATGSVQAALAPYWSRRLGVKKLSTFQASARGGELFSEVTDNAVCITGQVLFVSRGRICLGA
jgi:PhzF family phenazine biosynthesis protein